MLTETPGFAAARADGSVLSNGLIDAAAAVAVGADTQWPTLLGNRAAGRALRGSSKRVVTGTARLVWWVIALAWAVVTASFWLWWLGRAGSGTSWLFWPQTFSLAYQSTALPTFFFYYLYKMRRPIEVQSPAGMRVAMITLCVPGHESLEVIREQLEALRSVTYEHDSWVLDEGASPDVETLAEELGVQYFTRKGVARWNEPHAPFQRATKAGNVNAWLDHIGKLGVDYEVFVQFDIDHRPRPDYLDRVLGYFRDSKVAWVQAPSVCGNLDNWAARGLAEQDMIFQGPLQMGFYGASQTPFIIGSHTSYRTTAIREIGGFQPTRAEDHLDTVVLASRGYKGVFVPEIIAVGDGPHDFATYLRQQFAWAHSMIQIFLRHTPRLLSRYSIRQALQFLMCQSWYTLWSVSLAILWASPTVALVADKPIAAVPISKFLVYFLPVPLTSTMMWCWSRRWFQPAGLRLSWRGILLEIARWPVVLWALINVLLGVTRSYMITPKGVGRPGGPRLVSIYGPYLVLSIMPLAALWAYALGSGSGWVRGYYGLVLLNGVFGVALLVTTLLIEFRTIGASGIRRLKAVGAQAAILTTVLSLICVLGLTAGIAWHPFLATLR
jgi:cellulose synthase/poly-beta-1,6-N-acetylglucosamine synthase-like glycosyltransferase